ncbi:cobalamin-binding protein [Undibacterium rugosum]|uniref:Cobalamin-binding protein n=1 Tax=Undibacterium rugosum TaxID=2762291 RepID=A0A923IAV4_9BURK|nr:cobalamin-binding protein [Undibacterium rugosum]MBC3936718.1 cobalamin-binding protein [Undibacterium rugosum]MBR7779704.1 cobalamin-binding protein [Undibacterium rugosum]
MSVYQRIACLSTEAVEVMYAIGAEDLVAGISGYTVRPARARDEKPKISGFSSAKIDKILAVRPDLVVAYSNMQAELSRELISAGVEVHAFNQRDVAGILHMIQVLAVLAGKAEAGLALVAELEHQIADCRRETAQWTRRPRVYFEEWNEPLMSGIGWVSELIEIAGGEDVFADRAVYYSAKDRIIADPDEVIRRMPDIIIASWCGKKFRAEQLMARPGWEQIPAVRHGRVFEIKSPDILSPGPAAIQHGLQQIQVLIADWQAAQGML